MPVPINLFAIPSPAGDDVDTLFRHRYLHTFGIKKPSLAGHGYLHNFLQLKYNEL